MVTNNQLLYSRNEKISFEKVNDEYCIYNEDTNRIAVLNSTAGVIFAFLNDCLENKTLISLRGVHFSW